jgi:hypothetical protein
VVKAAGGVCQEGKFIFLGRLSRHLSCSGQRKKDATRKQVAEGIDPGTLGRAYNRTTHLPERRKMMQGWADYLDKLKDTLTEEL